MCRTGLSKLLSYVSAMSTIMVKWLMPTPSTLPVPPVRMHEDRKRARRGPGYVGRKAATARRARQDAAAAQKDARATSLSSILGRVKAALNNVLSRAICRTKKPEAPEHAAQQNEADGSSPVKGHRGHHGKAKRKKAKKKKAKKKKRRHAKVKTKTMSVCRCCTHHRLCGVLVCCCCPLRASGTADTRVWLIRVLTKRLMRLLIRPRHC